jgi:transposase InsO family protein
MKKGVPYEWSAQRQAAFEDLKHCMVAAPILALPIDGGSYTLDTDASDFAAGAVLQQQQGDALRVIAYASRTFHGAETRYSTNQKEMAAAIYGLKQFRQYLLGRQFLLRTDHAALTYLLTAKDVTGRQGRYLDFLAQFGGMKIDHRPGVSHRNGDSLSRRPEGSSDDSTAAVVIAPPQEPTVVNEVCDELFGAVQDNEEIAMDVMDYNDVDGNPAAALDVAAVTNDHLASTAATIDGSKDKPKHRPSGRSMRKARGAARRAAVHSATAYDINNNSAVVDLTTDIDTGRERFSPTIASMAALVSNERATFIDNIPKRTARIVNTAENGSTNGARRGDLGCTPTRRRGNLLRTLLETGRLDGYPASDDTADQRGGADNPICVDTFGTPTAVNDIPTTEYYDDVEPVTPTTPSIVADNEDVSQHGARRGGAAETNNDVVRAVDEADRESADGDGDLATGGWRFSPTNAITATRRALGALDILMGALPASTADGLDHNACRDAIKRVADRATVVLGELNDERQPPPTKKTTTDDAANHEDLPEMFGRCCRVVTRTGEKRMLDGLDTLVKDGLLPTDLDIRHSQITDDVLGPLMDWLVRDRRPSTTALAACSTDLRLLERQWTTLSVRDGMLMKRQDGCFRFAARDVIVLPATLQRAVVTACHVESGHQGHAKTMDCVGRRVYFLRWRQVVRTVCDECPVCAAYCRGQPPRQGLMQMMEVYNPMDRVAIDFTGPHPTTARQNKYILTMVECFSRYLIAVPVRNRFATTVAKVLIRHLFSKWGLCKEILSDQGAEFNGKLMKELCCRFGVKKIRTSAFRPGTNGRCERVHRDLNAMFAKLVNDDQTDWDILVESLTASFNGCVNRSTGFSPNFLMTGREALTSVDLVLDAVRPVTSRRLYDHVDKLHCALELAFSAVRQKSRDEARKRKAAYDRKVRQKKFAVGQSVLVRREPVRPGLYPKWVRKFEGPYKVLAVLSDVNYLVRRAPAGKQRVVHVDRMRRWRKFHATATAAATAVVAAVDATANEDNGIDDSLVYDPLRRSRRQAAKAAAGQPGQTGPIDG